MSKVIGFTINIQGSQDAVNAAEELRRKIAEVQKALRATSDQSDVQKLGNYLIDLKAQQAEVNKVIRDQIKLRQQEIREATKTKDTYSDLSARLNTLRNRYKDMAAAQEESTDEAKALLKEVQELDKRLKDIDSSVGQFQRNVGNYGSAFDAISPQFSAFREGIAGIKEQTTGAGKALAGASLAIAAFGVISDVTARVKEFADEYRNLSTQISTLTGLQGQALTDVTAKAKALGDTYNESAQDISVAANVVAKEFGITVGDALDKIAIGFNTGANAQGDFLDQLREYPAQFRQAGASADEFLTVLIRAQQEGIYSDKGVDLVKEFGLRIREQTTATRDALLNAFGPTFTNDLLKGVNDGSISVTEALKKVSNGLKDTGLTASQVQTVIADVFGGPGEDAGLRFIQLLGDLGGNLDDVRDKSNKLQTQQEQLYEANLEAAQASAEVSKALANASAEIDLLKVRAQSFLARTAAGFLEFFNKLPATLKGVRAAIAEVFTIGNGKSPAQAYRETYLAELQKIRKEDEQDAQRREKEAEARAKQQNEKAKASARARGKATGEAFVEGSIAAIQKEASRLNQEIDRTLSGSVAQQALIARLRANEVELEKAVERKNRLLLEAERKAAAEQLGQAQQLAQHSLKVFIESETAKTRAIPDEVKKRAVVFRQAIQEQQQQEQALTQEWINTAFSGVQEAFSLIDGIAQVTSQKREERFQKENDRQAEIIRTLEEQAQTARGVQKKRLEQQIVEAKKFQEKQLADQEAIRLKAAKREKGLAIIQSIIQGALAVQRALANPPGPPFSIPQAVGAGVFAAVQTALIAAQPLATGGMITGRRVTDRQNIPTMGNGDNVLATVRRGEVVLNARQQGLLGGARTFKAIGVPGFADGGAINPITAPVIPGLAAGSDIGTILKAIDRKTDAVNARIDRLKAFVVSDEVARDLKQAETIRLNATL